MVVLVSLPSLRKEVAFFQLQFVKFHVASFFVVVVVLFCFLISNDCRVNPLT